MLKDLVNEYNIKEKKLFDVKEKMFSLVFARAKELKKHKDLELLKESKIYSKMIEYIDQIDADDICSAYENRIAFDWVETWRFGGREKHHAVVSEDFFDNDVLEKTIKEILKKKEAESAEEIAIKQKQFLKLKEELKID